MICCGPEQQRESKTMDTEDAFSERFGDLVGRGAQATVYARDNVAVKVYNAGYPNEFVFYEAAVMGFVEATGIPMSKPYEELSVDGQMCLKMSRVTGQSVYDMMAGDPDRATALMDDLVQLQMDIHAQEILSDGVNVSPVLKEMHVPREYAMGTIRFSVGRYTSETEIDRVVERVGEVVAKQRRSLS